MWVRTILMFGFAAALPLTGLFAADDAKPVALPDLRTRQIGADWPEFLGPARNGISTEKGLISPWPHTGPRLVWQLPAGTGYGAPVVARGRLFLFDRQGDQAILFCLNAETGAEVWRFAYPTDYEDQLGYSNGPRACPVVDDDRVYIFGAQGKLHCLSVMDGTVRWKVDTREKYHVVQNFFGAGSVPVIEGRLLIALIGGSPPGEPATVYAAAGKVRSSGKGIVAFDKMTGEVVYEITDALASYASPMIATIGDRRWCFVFARAGLHAFEPTTGKIDFFYPWRSTKLESVNAANPVVVGDRVLISETYGPGTTVLKVKSGGYDVVWKDEDRGRKILQTHWNTPVHVDGFVYACSGRHSGGSDLRCVELATGAVKWVQRLDERSSVILADGHLVMLGEFGRLSLIKVNSEKFDPVSSVDLGDRGAGLLGYPAWASPVLSHGLLYVRGKDRLICLELIPAKP